MINGEFFVTFSPVWRCPLCTISYDNVEIEYLLIDNVQRKSMAYTLQDLQCKKCLQVGGYKYIQFSFSLHYWPFKLYLHGFYFCFQIKLDNMSEYCSCAGEYRTLVSKTDLTMHLRMFRSIADHFKMPLLLDIVDWNLKMNGNITKTIT